MIKIVEEDLLIPSHSLYLEVSPKEIGFTFIPHTSDYNGLLTPRMIHSSGRKPIIQLLLSAVTVVLNPEVFVFFETFFQRTAKC